MRGAYTQLFLHLVWATWDRLPLIKPEYEARLYGGIRAKCDALRCDALALGGIEDHIHLLVAVPPTIAPSFLIAEVKGTSSHLMTHEIAAGIFFKWQGSYGAFSAGKDALPAITAYIANQKAHHARGTLIDDYETVEAPDHPSHTAKAAKPPKPQPAKAGFALM